MQGFFGKLAIKLSATRYSLGKSCFQILRAYKTSNKTKLITRDTGPKKSKIRKKQTKPEIIDFFLILTNFSNLFYIIEKEIKLIMFQIFSAIKYLHQKRIVHRDLSYNNIIYNSLNK